MVPKKVVPLYTWVPEIFRLVAVNSLMVRVSAGLLTSSITILFSLSVSCQVPVVITSGFAGEHFVAPSTTVKVPSALNCQMSSFLQASKKVLNTLTSGIPTWAASKSVCFQFLAISADFEAGVDLVSSLLQDEKRRNSVNRVSPVDLVMLVFISLIWNDLVQRDVAGIYCPG